MNVMTQMEYPAKPQLTKKGYHRFWAPRDNPKDKPRQILAHNWVWQQHYGDTPKGMQVHHKNGNKLDNRISNLELIDPLTHKRIHSGCEMRDGVWWKPCHGCGEVKPVTKEYWYMIRKDVWPMTICKKCHVKAAVISKRKRRERKKALGIPWQLRD